MVRLIGGPYHNQDLLAFPFKTVTDGYGIPPQGQVTERMYSFADPAFFVYDLSGDFRGFTNNPKTQTVLSL